MLYRPAYCCNCGEKVVRDEWRMWTSRRFCALCATEHQGVDLLPKIVAGVSLFAIVFSVASGLRTSPYAVNEGPAPVQKLRSNLRPPNLLSVNPAATAIPGPGAESISNSSVAQDTQQTEQPQREKRTSDETVYYCGAVTKKGTPCTRRVKTKGFCWQHAKSGQIAPARF